MRAECTWYRSIYCSLCYSAVSPLAAMRKRLFMKQRPLFSSILYAHTHHTVHSRRVLFGSLKARIHDTMVKKNIFVLQVF